MVKENGQGGFNTDLAVFTKGGRTQTLWFTNTATLSAGVTTYLRPIHAGTFTPALLTYPIYGQGCVIGMVAQIKSSVTTGFLKFIPYATNGWGGAIHSYTTELNVVSGADRSTVTSVLEADNFPYTGNYEYNNLGVYVTPSSSPGYVGPNDLMVGLVIAY